MVSLRALSVQQWFEELSCRLFRVKVVCGDCTRVLGGSWRSASGPCGVFLDPPYAAPDRDRDVYAEDSLTVAGDVRAWALKHGALRDHRICLAGYDEHSELADRGWRPVMWTAQGGYGNQRSSNKNRFREVLWFSPHCLTSA